MKGLNRQMAGEIHVSVGLSGSPTKGNIGLYWTLQVWFGHIEATLTIGNLQAMERH